MLLRWVLTVFDVTKSSPAISALDIIVGRKRSTDCSRPLSGSSSSALVTATLGARLRNAARSSPANERYAVPHLIRCSSST